MKKTIYLSAMFLSFLILGLFFSAYDHFQPAFASESGAHENGDSNIQEISQEFFHGNSISTIFVKRNIAFTLSSFGLILFDMSNPEQPQLLGSWGNQLSWTHDQRNFVIQDDFVYIVDRSSGFFVIDVSDSTNPQLCSFYALSGFFTGPVDIALNKDVAIIAARRSGLLIFDVRNPYDPQLIGSYTKLNDALAVKTNQNIAYTLDLASGLVVLDLSEPTSPTYLAHSKTTYTPATFTIDTKNNHAYVVLLESGIDIIDLSNPLNPQVIHNFQPAEYLYDLAIVDAMAYILGDDPAEIQTMDISDPYHPFKINAFPTDGSCIDIHIADGIGYIAHGSAGIKIIDFRDPTEYKLINEFFQGNATNDLALHQSYLYLAKEHGGLQILDVRNAIAPMNLGDFPIGDFIERIKIKDNVLYVLLFNTKIELYDLGNDPLRPQFLSQIYLTADSDDFDTDGNYLFWAKDFRGVHIYNIKDKRNPKWIGEIETKDKAYGVHLDSATLYVAVYNAGLQIFNVADPYSPRELGAYNSQGKGYDVTAKNDHAFLAVDTGLEIINVENPALPYSVFRFDGLQKAQRLYLSDNYLSLSCYQHGIYIFDITEPDNPALAGSYNTPGVALNITNINDISYVADRFTLGIYQLNYQPINISFTIAGKINYFSNQHPMTNLAIQLIGTSMTRVDSTDENGNFRFEKLESGNYVVKPLSTSTGKQAITPYDASLILQNDVGLIELLPIQKIAADVTGNGEVTAYDASFVLQYCVGLTDNFPVNKGLAFVPNNFDMNDSNWNHAPDSIVFGNLSGDMLDQHFNGVIVGDVSGNWQANPLKSGNSTLEMVAKLPITITANTKIIPVHIISNEQFASARIHFELIKNAGVKDIFPGALLSHALFAANITDHTADFVFAAHQPIQDSGEIILLAIETLNDSLGLSDVLASINIELDEKEVIVIWSQLADVTNARPSHYVLEQNYPNPFNHQTLIRFQLPTDDKVRLEIYNLNGQKISTVIDDFFAAGSYAISFHATELQSGIYWYCLTSERVKHAKKMIVVK